jgi:hypothetical protein
VFVFVQDITFLQFCIERDNHYRFETAQKDPIPTATAAAVVGRRAQQLLIDISHYLPGIVHVCSAAGICSMQMIARGEITNAPIAALCHLFVTEFTLEHILSCLFVKCNMTAKGA